MPYEHATPIPHRALYFALAVASVASVLSGPLTSQETNPESRAPRPPTVTPGPRIKARDHSAPAHRPQYLATAPPRPWQWNSDTPAFNMYGYAAAAGDVNGDGCADILISEPGYDEGKGRVLAWFGSPFGLPEQPAWMIQAQTNSPTHLRDLCAQGAGDLNGDGCDDIVVTLSFRPEDRTNGVDRFEVFYGSPDGLAERADWRVTAPELGAVELVYAIRAGDVNGDGFGDLCAGAALRKSDGTGAFRFMVFLGSMSGLKHPADTAWELDRPLNAGFPSLACAGDVNKDGYDDLLEGDPGWSGTAQGYGRVRLYLGSARGLNPTPAWVTTCDLPIRPPEDSAYDRFFGRSVAGAGDVNHDGFADIIIGAPFAERSDVNEGLAFVYLGSRTGLRQRPDWIIEGNQPHALLGYSVDGAGDINGDGFADVIVGASEATNGQINEGAALVFLGSKHGLSRSPHWCVESDKSNQRFGRLVRSVGDVNGDGCDDILVAASEFDADEREQARAVVFYGSPAGLTGSAGWRIEKPWLLAMQQRLDHISIQWKLLTAGTLVLASLGLLIGWRRALARQRQAERETARAQERERISRDLHDQLGANLSQIALWTDLASRAGHGNEQTREHLDRIGDSAGSALRNMRQLVQTLTPTNPSLGAFAEHLADLAQECLEPTDLQLQLDLPATLPEFKLTSEAHTNLSMAAREALRNAVQHARARRVTLALAIADHTLRLTITDDGQGFVPHPFPPASDDQRGHAGNGLRNLQSRAAALGGTLEIQSQPDQGTTMAITVPLKRVTIP